LTECNADVAVVVASLVRLATLQSVVSDRLVGLSGFPTPASSLSFPTGSTVFTVHRPPRAFTCGFILSGLRSSSENCLVKPASRLPTLSTFHGVAVPSSRHQPVASLHRVSTPDTVRPRRFARPRRFVPPLALWVCFAPQPRSGFALQGFAPALSRIASSTTRALSSLVSARC